MQTIAAITLILISIMLFWAWKKHKISNDTFNALTGIFTIVAGVAAIILFFIPAPQPAVPATNPTQVLLIINASPLPTFTPLPISTLTPSQITDTSSQSAYVETPSPSVTNTETQPNSKFSIPWGNWIIDSITFMPKDTWIALTIFFGVLFLIAGAAVFYITKVSSEFRVAYNFFAVILTFTVSIYKWGW